MTCLVQQQAPAFRAQAVMPNGSFQELVLEDYRGQYVVLFFYPLDFTFVCPTEIIAFSDAAEQFQQRGVQLLSCSVDSHYTHLAWRERPRNEGGLGDIAFPMLADLNKQISGDYGVLLDGGISLRGLFLIDKEGVVRHQLVNDLPLGRSIPEALRIVEALQYFETHGEVCPANWQQGDLTISPDPKKSRDYFEKANSQLATAS